LPLRSVVFDYGMVLSEAPNPEAREQLRRITGLSEADLDRHYWVDRHAYDRGDFTGLEFWQRLVDNAGLTLQHDEIVSLNIWDALMWTTINPAMLAWHRQLKAQGFKTAILSNMGDAVMESILEKFAWIEDFDVLIWSYQHRLAKPEAAIYELLLSRLGTAPEETLFLDDKLENIEAARGLGIQGLQFSTVPQLREDLITASFDSQLPLP
jgi:putative hydrolase of the HAD superfamily